MEAKIGQTVLTAEERRSGRNEFRCIRPGCDATVPMHGLHWVHEVCPKCLQVYAHGLGADYSIHASTGFWMGTEKQQMLDKIAYHGGRYVPHFNQNECGCQRRAPDLY